MTMNYSLFHRPLVALWIPLVLVSALTLTSCQDRDSATASQDSGTNHSVSEVDRGISLPESVRRSLGVTFARVEARRMQTTNRVPGRFEGLMDARRDYSAPLSGLVQLHVRLYDQVTTGQLLFTLESREWRTIQSGLAAAEARIHQTSATMYQAEVTRRGSDLATSVALSRGQAGLRHKDSLRIALESAQAEYEQMQNLQQRFGGKVVELNETRSRMAAAQAALRQAEEETLDTQRDILRLNTEGGGSFGPALALDAVVEARRTEWLAAQTDWMVSRAAVASVLQIPKSRLDEPVTGADGTTQPRWLAVDKIEVRAANGGMVRDLAVASGGRVEPETAILRVVDTQQVVFRATILQVDLGHYAPGLRAQILPPAGIEKSAALEGTVAAWVDADAHRRTADLLIQPQQTAAWSMDGVTAEADVILSDSEEPVPAIPEAALTQDGLETILFRRDPKNPDRVMRLVADLGLRGGGWAAIESGLGLGDEVVVGGIQQLKLATQAAPAKAGHFHADGTWHEGSH